MSQRPRCFGKGAIGVISSAVRRSVRSQINRSHCLKLLPIKRSSPSRTCGCSKNPGAQRRIARGSGASDRNRRGARHHQPLAHGRAPVLDAIVESAARVCGIDDVLLRLREGNDMVRGLISVPCPLPASRSALMSHSIAGCASMARSTFPMSARRMIFPRWVPPAAISRSSSAAWTTITGDFEASLIQTSSDKRAKDMQFYKLKSLACSTCTPVSWISMSALPSPFTSP